MKFTVTYQFNIGDDEWVLGFTNYDTLEDATSSIIWMNDSPLYRFVSSPLVPYSTPEFPEHFKN